MNLTTALRIGSTPRVARVAIAGSGGPTNPGAVHWDGNSWTAASFQAGYMVYAIDMLSSTDGWATDYWGVSMHWDGSSWQRIGDAVGAGPMYGLDMLSAAEGWAVGDSGTILRYTGLPHQVMLPATLR